jgi:alcohol dehydrogenase
MESELKLRKFVAPEFIFGFGALKLAGRYAKNLGASRILVVTDPGVMAAGWTDQVIGSLTLEALPYVIYSGVTPNPRAEEVMGGAELYKNTGCNLIMAVGGGSVIDCAKGIGIVVTNRKHILEFEGVDQVAIPMPPLICIPTTGGTSADVSQFAIISNTQEKNKIAIISKAVVPDVSLIDPLTLTTMDNYLAACTGLDALTHAIEAYVSIAHSPITDLHALAAIRLLSSHLVPSLAEPNNVELRKQVMLASLEAGLAFSNASLGAVHAMAHSLGGLLDLPHGEANAILLEHVMSFNFPEAGERFSQIGEAMGLDLQKRSLSEKKAAILAEIGRLRKAVGIDKSLGQKGVSRADIPQLSKKAMNDPCIVTNPRHPVQRDIEVIFEEAL